jgi:hypothetical protein
MRTLWVLTLGLAALATTQGCKRKEPEPIPGPKAVSVAIARAPGMWRACVTGRIHPLRPPAAQGLALPLPIRAAPWSSLPSTAGTGSGPPRCAAWYNSPRLGL